MKDCELIAPLLGACQDGELEPHEMQNVARHLATCKTCEEELADYNAIGLQLREAITIPPLTGFAAGVDRRIAAMAKAESSAAPSLASTTTDSETTQVLVPNDEDSEQLASSPEVNPGDSQAIIKRLESQVPTTAVWSE